VKKAVLAALAVTCLAAPALAQTAPTATAPGTAMPAAADSGMKMADTATVKLRYVTVKPADVMSSKLVGTTI
jgi:hypothetical protein